MIAYPAFSEKSLAVSRYLAIIMALFAPASTAVSSIASIGMLVAWLVSGQALNTLKMSFKHPVGKAVLLFVAWLVIGTLYADTRLDDKLTTLSSWKKLFFVFVLLGLFYQEQWQKRFLTWYIGFMGLAAIIALPLWLLNINVRAGATGPGIFMTNWSTQSMAFIAALLCCLFAYKQLTNPLHKKCLWGLMAIFLFDIFFVSVSRSGYLALFPALIFAGIVMYGSKKLPQILVVILGISLLVALGSTSLQERIKLAMAEKDSYQTSANDTAIGLRMVFYKNTIEIIKQRPLLGYGTSGFAKAYADQVEGKFTDWHGIKTADPHNQYMFVLAENGIIGLLIFLGYIFVCIRHGLRYPPYGAIAASFLVAICVSSLFNSHFKTFAEGNLLACFLGILLAHPSLGTAKE